MVVLSAPHKNIKTQDEKEKFLVELFDSLWQNYRSKMVYVQKYEKLILSHRAHFLNDHIAFRTIASEKPATGIFVLARIFEALGYSAAGCYEFRDKHLSSIHYQHPNAQFPKLFITELKSWELSKKSQEIIGKAMCTHRQLLFDQTLSDLWNLAELNSSQKKLHLKLLASLFKKLPWDLPQKKDLLQLDRESQFGAWVLVNGYSVNHFTALVNSHGVKALDDIERVAKAMKGAGIPMKKEIEGKKGSKLRQTSTESVVTHVLVKDGFRKIKIPWTYAYFEIAERPWLKNPVTAKMERFEGFLGGQAANLFEMTKMNLSSG